MGYGGHESGGEGEEEDDEDGPYGDEDEEGIPVGRERLVNVGGGLYKIIARRRLERQGRNDETKR